ncbi:hypothetical protein B0I37DRAFT_331027, partial [Chaetomium sp. MPI-CAGE-AT-0009]
MINDVPPIIFRLFRSVIKARTSMHESFLQMVANNPDPATEKSNLNHRHFIDALTDAFHALGGKDWPSTAGNSSTDGPAAVDSTSHPKDYLDRLLLSNQFVALDLGSTTDTHQETEESDHEATPDAQPGKDTDPASRRRQKARTGKRKKDKRAKKSKGPLSDDVPLESYRIIQDTGGVTPDYMMAVYAIMLEWVDLRGYLQGVWHECAYDGLNTAVASGVSHLAIAMIQRSATEIFTIMHTISRGDRETSEGVCKITLRDMAKGEAKTVHATFADLKEDLMIYTYRDLMDFLEDFQKTRSGKPTKRMLGQIRDWDPKLNLEQATDEERVRWRRSYTINWLYDLVNLFSSTVVRRNTVKGEAHVLEEVDWSPTGPWAGKHRTLYGLNEFAGLVTSLAMQKQGTDIRKRILPHHVFQLQCIVDSLMVSRGWSLSPSRGHKLKPPPPDFRPRRDLDLFLDRNVDRTGHGFLQAAVALREQCAAEAEARQTPELRAGTSVLLHYFRVTFCQSLGDSRLSRFMLSRENPGLTRTLPSRFSNSDPNGLWNYSPFLCGAGLMEGLELAYLVGMRVWGSFCEPVATIHLHNMLVQKKYLKEPVELYKVIQHYFAPAFFLDGKVPSSNFLDAFSTRIHAALQAPNLKDKKQNVAAKYPAQVHYNFHILLALDLNRFFNIKSGLSLFRPAKWNIHAIPDADIPLNSPLFRFRIAHTNRTTDPVTHQTRLDDTEFVRRARAAGMTDEAIIEMGRAPKPTGEPFPSAYTVVPTGDPTTSQRRRRRSTTTTSSNTHPSAERHRLLDAAKTHLLLDITGTQRPLSSFNYIAATGTMMKLFVRMEAELRRRRNRVYVRAYESKGAVWGESKRAALVYWAMVEGDEECLRVMARVFEGMDVGFVEHVYWEGLRRV